MKFRLIEFGGLTVYSYGLCLLISFVLCLAALILLLRRRRAQPRDRHQVPDHLHPLMTVHVLGGVKGCCGIGTISGPLNRRPRFVR